MATRQQQRQWFIKVRGSYLPNNASGWLTYIPYTGFLILTIMYVMTNGYDWTAAMLVLFPNWVAALVVMNWIAERHS